VSVLDLDAVRRRTDNPGFARMFRPGRLTLGVFFPIEAFERDRPTMRDQVALAQRAERAGFAALWFRDVPLRDPAFGDVGQVFDPWVYLGYIAAHTRSIALATGSIVLPIRHPIHTAKAAGSVDQLSGGRLVLGIASGDRPVEFPAFNVDPDTRGETFREHLHAVRRLLGEPFPALDGSFGSLRGADLVPKPWADGVPLLVTGNSRQSLEWIAQHADGWITYPRPLEAQERVIRGWRSVASLQRPGEFLPFAQSLYIDLTAHPAALPQPIHLGWRLGRNHLVQLLAALRTFGANHVVLNLKYGRRPADEVLDELAEFVVPEFASGTAGSRPRLAPAPEPVAGGDQ
jgi:luciferase-type oxidoreductase